MCGNSWVFSKCTIKELAVACVPLCALHSAADRQTDVFAQTESKAITWMTHGTFIESSFHIEVFTLFQSMPSSEPLHHQYVDVLFVPAVTVSSEFNITQQGDRGTGFLK